jgi:hypothetical protein
MGIWLYSDLRFKLGYVGADDEPALFLYRKGILGRSAILPMNTLHEYWPDSSKDNNEDVVWIEDMGKQVTAAQFTALVKARGVAEFLGMTPDWDTVNRLLSIIQSRIQAVFDMPPRIPVFSPNAEADVFIDGTRVATVTTEGPDARANESFIKLN